MTTQATRSRDVPRSTIKRAISELDMSPEVFWYMLTRSSHHRVPRERPVQPISDMGFRYDSREAMFHPTWAPPRHRPPGMTAEAFARLSATPWKGSTRQYVDAEGRVVYQEDPHHEHSRWLLAFPAGEDMYDPAEVREFLDS